MRTTYWDLESKREDSQSLLVENVRELLSLNKVWIPYRFLFVCEEQVRGKRRQMMTA
jgi:hypothetical protein